MSPRFEWDAGKAAANERKHGISFEEAQAVFFDDNARIINDSEHSQAEDRFVILGMSSRHRALVVVHCYRKDDAVIRLISARKATKRERAQYEEHIQ